MNAKHLVRRAGITLDELKPVFQVGTRAAVGHYLNGKRHPTPAQLKRLADYLGVRIDAFFDGQSADSAAERHLDRLRMFSETTHDQVFGIRYDWPNPGGLDQDVLIHKVLAAQRFEDVLALARRIGIERLEQAAAADARLAANTALRRMLDNIRRGYERTRTDAA